MPKVPKTQISRIEAKRIAADHAYWKGFADKLGWRVYGFNNRDSVAYWVEPGGGLLEMTRSEVEHTTRSLELWYQGRKALERRSGGNQNNG